MTTLITVVLVLVIAYMISVVIFRAISRAFRRMVNNIRTITLKGTLTTIVKSIFSIAKWFFNHKKTALVVMFTVALVIVMPQQAAQVAEVSIELVEQPAEWVIDGMDEVFSSEWEAIDFIQEMLDDGQEVY